MTGDDKVVNSPIGRATLDSIGSPIGAVRLNPALSYPAIPNLLKRVIDEDSEEAWADIINRIDYTYTCLGHALDALEGETGFSREIKARVTAGKKLLFKPNLVNPVSINHITHGPGNIAVCTPWSFIAALMRWFHDRLDISYHQMLLAEGGTTMSATAGAYTRTLAGSGVITTRSVIEGRSGDFYGGWGFYFARKYLADTHNPAHTDDPMNGYRESIDGISLPPGRAPDKLMVYDLNKINIDTNGRDITVPNGVNYQTITLHKAVVGGNPDDSQDRKDWPGCVLVNVPKLKVHVTELLTSAIKNIGVGLFPMELNVSDKPDSIRWKYAIPHKPMPGIKLLLPHAVWVYELDDKTGLPRRDKDGNYVEKKTGGMSATMADVIATVKSQDTCMLHVVDAIEATNGLQAGVLATAVPEGYIFASTDPVALDVLGARYLFTNVPVAEARKIQREQDLPTDFLQKVPLPVFDGRNIVTAEGYDSPVPRYPAFQHCRERGLGQQDYYLVGQDDWQGGNLASVKQHLGRVENTTFTGLLTREMYFSQLKPLWDLQATTLAYVVANDKLTGSSYRKDLFSALDENGDGVIDNNEKGRLSTINLDLDGYASRLQAMDTTGLEIMRLAFLIACARLRLLPAAWNPESCEFGRREEINAAVIIGMNMSQAPVESADPLFPGLTWGKGKWPSLRFALRTHLLNRLYGPGFPAQFSIMMAPYGYAFRYADLKWADGRYAGSGITVAQEDAIGKYHNAVASGDTLLPFSFYVPTGYGSTDNGNIPNVEETDDPALIFTTSFNDGREHWQELDMTTMP